MTGVIRVTGTAPDIKAHDFGGFQSRHKHTLQLLKDAFTLYREDLNGLAYDFHICTCDNPESAIVLADKSPWVLTYSITDACPPNILPIPDFVFSGWPEAGIDSYTTSGAAIIKAGAQSPQIDKVFWIGTTHLHDLRQKMVQLGADHPEDMHFVSMEWCDPLDAVGGRLPASTYVSLPDHCAYSMLLDVRGAGYSGRLKLLMHAARPVFVIDRPFREYFYGLMKPYEHFIPVKEDLSDLAAKVKEVKSNPEHAHKLGTNALAFARTYLTRDYALSYLRDALLKIANSPNP